MRGWWFWQSVWKLKLCVDQECKRGRPMSRYEPPGTESLHQGVRAAGPVCCGAEKIHLTWPGRDNPASASVHQPPGQRASRPLSSLQTSAVAEVLERLFVRQTGAQQKLVPTAKKNRKENLLTQSHELFDLHEDEQIKTVFSSLYSYLSLNNIIHHIWIRWQIHKDFQSLNLK